MKAAVRRRRRAAAAPQRGGRDALRARAGGDDGPLLRALLPDRGGGVPAFMRGQTQTQSSSSTPTTPWRGAQRDRGLARPASRSPVCGSTPATCWRSPGARGCSTRPGWPSADRRQRRPRRTPDRRASGAGAPIDTWGWAPSSAPAATPPVWTRSTSWSPSAVRASGGGSPRPRWEDRRPRCEAGIPALRHRGRDGGRHDRRRRGAARGRAAAGAGGARRRRSSSPRRSSGCASGRTPISLPSPGGLRLGRRRACSVALQRAPGASPPEP